MFFQPIDILMHTAGTHYHNEDPAGYVQHLCKTLHDVHALASAKLRAQLKYQKQSYDLRLQQSNYEIGDFVYRLNSATKNR